MSKYMDKIKKEKLQEDFKGFDLILLARPVGEDDKGVDSNNLIANCVLESAIFIGKKHFLEKNNSELNRKYGGKLIDAMERGIREKYYD